MLTGLFTLVKNTLGSAGIGKYLLTALIAVCLSLIALHKYDRRRIDSLTGELATERSIKSVVISNELACKTELGKQSALIEQYARDKDALAAELRDSQTVIADRYVERLGQIDPAKPVVENIETMLSVWMQEVR